MKKNRILDILNGIHCLDHALNIMSVYRSVVYKSQILKDGRLLTVDKESEEVLDRNDDPYQSPAEESEFLEERLGSDLCRDISA